MKEVIKMPIEVAPKSGLGEAVSDAKEFAMPGQIENITPRPACTAPPCRGCKRPCSRGFEEAPLVKEISTKTK